MKKLFLALIIGVCIGLLFMLVGYAAVWLFEKTGPLAFLGVVGMLYGTVLALDKLPNKL